MCTDYNSTLFQVVPICESHGVDTLIAGHDHNLQHIQRTGNVDIDYVVSGGGGRSLYAYESVRYFLLSSTSISF